MTMYRAHFKDLPLYRFADSIVRWSKRDLLQTTRTVDTCLMLQQPAYPAVMSIRKMAILLNVSRATAYRLCSGTADGAPAVSPFNDCRLNLQPRSSPIGLSFAVRLLVKVEDVLEYIESCKEEKPVHFFNLETF
jgi:hypothetical protein